MRCIFFFWVLFVFLEQGLLLCASDLVFAFLVFLEGEVFLRLAGFCCLCNFEILRPSVFFLLISVNTLFLFLPFSWVLSLSFFSLMNSNCTDRQFLFLKNDCENWWGVCLEMTRFLCHVLSALLLQSSSLLTDWILVCSSCSKQVVDPLTELGVKTEQKCWVLISPQPVLSLWAVLSSEPFWSDFSLSYLPLRKTELLSLWKCL